MPDIDDAVAELLALYPVDAVLCAISRAIADYAEQAREEDVGEIAPRDTEAIPRDASAIRQAAGGLSAGTARRIDLPPRKTYTRVKSA